MANQLSTYPKLQFAFNYLRYYLQAANGKGHGIHSPFVFEFITKILNDKSEYADYKKIEELRRTLLHDKKVVTVEDLGAGSSSFKSNRRSIASIARVAVKGAKYAQLLYRIIRYYQPQHILELGTSLGVTTAYLSSANSDANVFTLEGAAEIAQVAKRNFQQLELKNVKLVEGNFDYTLPAILHQLPRVDFAFIDGNHRHDPTLNYFIQIVSKVDNNSTFVFDDIHWSKEMEVAWNKIKEHPRVACTIDLFFIGVVFFRQQFKEKQHFTIRF